MESLEIGVEEFEMEPQMRCQGMCSGACSCPTGFCKCGISSEYFPTQEVYKEGIPSPESYHFKQVA